MRVAFTTLGCKVNQAESDALRDALPSGVRESASVDADVIVINTCTVTGEADRKVRKAIHQALALPQSPTVLVTGCLAVVEPDSVSALSERVIICADKSRLPDVLAGLAPQARDTAVRGSAKARSGGEACVPQFGSALSDARVSGFTDGVDTTSRSRRARVAVKVQDGCDTGCSYCIIPRARGVPRSVPVLQVLREVEALVAAGVREVVLTGITIGAYDDGGVRLPGLLQAVAGTGVPRIRVSSVEPGDVTPELLDVAAGLPAFCRHLHIPLQSGCDRTLARMRRPYDTEGFASVIERVDSALPGAAVTTDVIVGFPGETDADDAASREFVRTCGFSRLHVFRFSPRAGTEAATLPDRVPAGIIAERARAMRECGEQLQAEWVTGFDGVHAEALVERVRMDANGLTIAEGTTREYLRVRVPVEGAVAGDLMQVSIGAPAADGTVEALPVR